MRNLQLLTQREFHLDEELIKFFSADVDSNFYVITEDNTLHISNLKSSSNQDSIPLEGDELLQQKSTITGCQYIPELESLCICTAQGDILLYDCNSSTAEVVGSLDSGILSMAWSPDYELVIFATKNGTLIEMTKEWDIVTEVPIHPNSSNPEHEQTSAVLSWRGDGKVFACLAPVGNNPVGVLRIFDRACVVESKSEANQDIELDNLSWRPSGSLIACTQRLPQKYDTIFFERNGLRHGEFSMREDCSIRYIEWNSGSDLFAILLHSKKTNQSAIQIWHMNNYYWYLKQDLRFGNIGEADEVLGFHWDEEDSMKLRAICKTGRLIEYQFHWEANVTLALRPDNPSSVGVIDGSSLFLTPLRRLVPPPPMAACTIQSAESINQITFGLHYEILLKLSNNTLAKYHSQTLPEYLPPIKKPGTKGLRGQGPPPRFDQAPELIRIYTPPDCLDLNKISQLTFVSDSHLFAFESQWDSKQSRSRWNLVDLILSDSGEIQLKNRVEIPGIPLRLYKNPDSGSSFISLENGEVLRIGKSLSLEVHSKFPSACHTIQSVVFGSAPSGLEKPKENSLESFIEEDEQENVMPASKSEIIVGLNSQSRFYVNGIEASRECNSFAIHDRYILFTTLTHKLKFIDHREEFSPELLDSTPLHTYDICSREVERGARIVSVVPFDTKVILQMPRGNLECIYPRALLVAQCSMWLDHFHYRTAFLEMRRHRIDLNLLVDHDPEAFFDHIRHFIEELESVSFLNLFLSCLTDDDVTKTLFPKRKPPTAQSKPPLPSYLIPADKKQSKINRTCQAVRKELQNLDENKFVLSILTTYVKSSPPQLGEALEVVRKLKKAEIAGSGSSGAVSAEAALDYLVFLVDVDQLFDVALGLYDFELTIMVATKSQKDPKEYLPFLKSLHDTTPAEFQRYKIDMHLGKFESALRNISLAQDESFYETAKELISSKQLYLLGLKLYESQTERFQELSKIYASYLASNGNFEEAGLIYYQVGDFENSFKSFQQTTDWEMIFALADKLEFPAEKTQKLAVDISHSFRNLARFADAANILLEYTSDVSEAVQCLIQGCLWDSALRLIHKHKLVDLEEQIRSAVEESQLTLVETLQTKFELYTKQFNRLKVVKTNKILNPPTFRLPNDPNLGDAFSETSSFASSMSSFSFVSVSEGGTQRRKRKKKKRLSSKEGSLYEEEYLVDALRKLIPSPEDTEEVTRLLKALVLLGFRDESAELQQLFVKLTSLIESSLEVLIAPVIPIPGDDQEEDIKIQQGIEMKEKMDRLYKPSTWQLSCVPNV